MVSSLLRAGFPLSPSTEGFVLDVLILNVLNLPVNGYGLRGLFN